MLSQVLSVLTSRVIFVGKVTFIFVLLVLLKIVLLIPLHIPPLKRAIGEKLRVRSRHKYLTADEIVDSMTFSGLLRHMIHVAHMQMKSGDLLSVGDTAPNSLLYRLFPDGTYSECRLLDFHHHGRPLVINFGSCTWSPFVDASEEFNSLTATFSGRADFVAVYIAEAHAQDEWAYVRNRFNIKQHRNLKDRVEAAKNGFKLNFECPILVEPMSNELSLQFSAHPDKLCIIENGKVAFIGKRGPTGYHVSEIERWLKMHDRENDPK